MMSIITQWITVSPRLASDCAAIHRVFRARLVARCWRPSQAPPASSKGAGASNLTGHQIFRQKRSSAQGRHLSMASSDAPVR